MHLSIVGRHINSVKKGRSMKYCFKALDFTNIAISGLTDLLPRV